MAESEGVLCPTTNRDKLQFAFQKIAVHEGSLLEKLIGYLKNKPNVRIIGTAETDPTIRVPTVSFVVNGKLSSSIVHAVDAAKIGIK